MKKISNCTGKVTEQNEVWVTELVRHTQQSACISSHTMWLTHSHEGHGEVTEWVAIKFILTGLSIAPSARGEEKFVSDRKCVNTKYGLTVKKRLSIEHAQKILAYLGFQCVDHPPYSPDLAPSDYHLFPGLKNQLKGPHFSSDAEVIAAAETWLDGQLSEFFFWVACKR